MSNVIVILEWGYARRKEYDLAIYYLAVVGAVVEMPSQQTWSLQLEEGPPTLITYDGSDFVTVNGMEVRVRHMHPTSTFSSFNERRCFTNYSGYKLEFEPKKKGGVGGGLLRRKSGYELKVDGRLICDEAAAGPKNFREMEEGSYVIAVGEGGGGDGGGGGGQAGRKVDSFGQEIACVGSPVRWDEIDMDGEGEGGGEEKRGSEVELIERVSGGSRGGEEVKEEVKGEVKEGDRKAGELPKGVEYDGIGYSAGITIGGKYRALGTFETVEEAERCYQEADTKFRRK
ncbi:hypothetical protein TrST_g9574 [Triparma strigata]|uniref:AP2/ERF domain-containing protein n=1 Tax=Triparma strigata TaxID=1606541 RepID=A0A9W7BZX5_9STRA|nr:hypothetical protein TrST_g9574 [Triparma strigata]